MANTISVHDYRRPMSFTMTLHKKGVAQLEWKDLRSSRAKVFKGWTIPADKMLLLRDYLQAAVNGQTVPGRSRSLKLLKLDGTTGPMQLSCSIGMFTFGLENDLPTTWFELKGSNADSPKKVDSIGLTTAATRQLHEFLVYGAVEPLPATEGFGLS